MSHRFTAVARSQTGNSGGMSPTANRAAQQAIPFFVQVSKG
ncbi:hypothetical protein QEN58_03200 [Halomonas alkaliantarctica]|uniref:Uncharacterized protein n=1 Tax=Halomonas alkaliantarctica TaxID=232346 RepID=A0ABY8LNT1_9GAMM|nr:hypothetical protein [Halomonas alkaliantarctica]WGI26078.1 hypothetical protein QEN58_03200 [Halomonas alkaliantarctica]